MIQPWHQFVQLPASTWGFLSYVSTCCTVIRRNLTHVIICCHRSPDVQCPITLGNDPLCNLTMTPRCSKLTAMSFVNCRMPDNSCLRRRRACDNISADHSQVLQSASHLTCTLMRLRSPGVSLQTLQREKRVHSRVDVHNRDYQRAARSSVCLRQSLLKSLWTVKSSQPRGQMGETHVGRERERERWFSWKDGREEWGVKDKDRERKERKVLLNETTERMMSHWAAGCKSTSYCFVLGRRL